jgi:2-polyprenyl-3-methyl-5-hydroxy-6-metoxy-1,4-benzoquinol methylase
VEASPIGPRRAVARIVSALPAAKRPYAAARFGILGPRLLSPMSRALPDEGRILDLGCGIGLLSAYLALVAPRRRMVGVEPNAPKIEIAKAAARVLGIANEYVAGTIESSGVAGPFDGIVTSDVLHHVPKDRQIPLLAHLASLLAPGGVLVIKDVTTRPLYKHFFAYLTDIVMAGPREPFSFRHHDEWARLLREAGFRVEVSHLRDPLPYAHVLFVARKA